MDTLLILGAGGHGEVVKEASIMMGNYARIEFLDDHNSEAIGTLSELKTFETVFTDVFVAIGNKATRRYYIELLEKMTYRIPSIIHPASYVSESASIGCGTFVGIGAIVNTGSVVGKGCILGIGAMVDHHKVVGDYAYVKAGECYVS